jgi:hypothetical protein
MKTSTQNDYAAPGGRNASGRTRRTLILPLWGVLICCVVIGSLLPAASPVMVAIGRLHIYDKLQHFCAYLALSFLPVIGLGFQLEKGVRGRNLLKVSPPLVSIKRFHFLSSSEH